MQSIVDKGTSDEYSNDTNNKFKISSLSCLRFIASLQIICFHYYVDTNTEYLNHINLWGGSALTFFFMLSGFLLAYCECLCLNNFIEYDINNL